jgi:hypothetical protein
MNGSGIGEDEDACRKRQPDAQAAPDRPAGGELIGLEQRPTAVVIGELDGGQRGDAGRLAGPRC